VLSAIGLMVGSLGLLIGFAGPAAAAPTGFPTTTQDCNHGGWANFTGIHFRNQQRCITWVQDAIVSENCLPGALADFQDSCATYAAQLGIPLAQFLAAVCHGQDFPVSNAVYVVNDPAGTDLLSLSSGNTAPFVTQPGHIYWIAVQGAWNNGPGRQADASYISDDGWVTHTDGPAFNQRNLETQINDRFVNWGPSDTGHHYDYWIMGDGNPSTCAPSRATRPPTDRTPRCTPTTPAPSPASARQPSSSNTR
jgi:hypothetical protein